MSVRVCIQVEGPLVAELYVAEGRAIEFIYACWHELFVICIYLFICRETQELPH